MNKMFMEKNDYIQIGGSLKQVIALDGTVRDVITGHQQQYILTSCHILITNDVLIACGFVKNADNVYCEILQDDYKSCSISTEHLPMEKEYLITLTDNSGMQTFKKSIIVLSELQDWVREKTGFELKIDELKLADAIN